ncbi:hypothetical protein H6A61_04475 [Bacteroides caecigallinarum]|uniref:hypothetical protein n=1 Tax=Bacteroides caecigallinarum TaxID=1411144 RepID=UPI00195BE16B|nr:hypothetical protein [Bacteroides caecigallinarum]MBM6960113.1 hypothetical protein [Bacteroides caecigallinarum]
MEIKEAIIKKGEWLLDALKRIGYDLIPTNTILDKTLTGLGATHSEIHSKRNSIIIEPNVTVILGKLNNNENLEAVYEKCTPYNIKKYLQMDIPYKKILCTPESFHKIRKAAEELRINIYKEYFCLFDECEKVTQDIDYRRKIAQPIYDFFKFENKAFVSATPLPMTHKEFERQKFQKIKIKPEYDYKKDLELIVTNSYYKRLKKVLDGMKDSKCVCIFFNVTDGINEIIENLGITDYKIFCSQKSVDKLMKKGISKAHSMIDYPLAKYNFFTCRFYSGLDIVLRKCKPDIIMLTDFSSANWTMIDPFTEAIQIQGRFRKTKKNDNVTYNSLTHISTINPEMRIRSKEELDIRIHQFIDDYNILKERHDKEIDYIRKEAIFDDMKGLKYQELIDEKGEINSFSIDNLYNEERVKSYYISAQTLYQAYKDTGFFNVTLNDVTECVGDDDIRKLNTTKQAIERRKILVQLLDKIHNDFENGRISFEDKDSYIKLLGEQTDAQYTINTYMKIGKVGIENAQYQKEKIDKAINQYEKEQAEILRFSPEVKKAIYEEFEMNVYINKNEIKNTLQAIYDEYGIKFKVKQDTIKDYYDTDNSGSINGGSYKLTAFKFSLVDF